MAHFEVRGKEHFEVRGKLPPCAIHGWSAVEDCPRPDSGSALNVRQYNSGACICWSQICMKCAKIQCVFKAPFLWATINSPSEVDVWRRRRKMHVVRVFHTRTEPHTFAGFNLAQNMQIYIVYRDHPLFKHVVHAFPFSAISEGSFCRARLRSSKSGWHHRSDRKDPKGQGTLCGHCRLRV